MSTAAHGMQTGEVHSRVVATVPRAIERACGFFEERTARLLAAHGLDETASAVWYEAADFAALCDDVLASTGGNTVRRIGKELADTYDWAVTPGSVVDALASLDGAYRDAHRGDAGGYDFQRTGAESGRLICRTPYPVELDEGLLRGIGQRFSDTGFTKSEVVDTHREDGLLVTTLDVHWWESTDISGGAETDANAEFRGHVGAD